VLNDFRLATRLLGKDRGFTAAAIVVLGLGIAVTNTAFTLVNGVLLRDLPFADPDRVVDLGDASYLEVQDWRAAARTFEDIAGAREQAMNVSDAEIPAERIRGAYVSAHAFALLGRGPAVGRAFRPQDDRVGAPSVVILGHVVWRTRYRSDPGIIGRTIRVNGAPSTVIGVMPDGFEFPMNARLWQPLAALPSGMRDDRSARLLDGFGRLRADVSAERARAELQVIDAALAQAYPDNRRTTPPNVTAYRSGIGAPIVAIMAALMGAVAFVLLIACANVANLLLARAAYRSREVAMRLSLGATRMRIVRQLLVESLVLACLGGVVALLLSAAGIRLFAYVVTQVDEPPPFWLSFPIDRQVFAFLAAVCLGTAVLFGLAPALHTSRASIVAVLNDASGRTAGSRHTRRWAGALVVGQLALAMVLLAGAGLMMRNLVLQVTMDAGVQTGRLMRMSFDLPPETYGSIERRRQFYAQLDERLEATFADDAALSSDIPMDGAEVAPLLFDGRPAPPPDARPTASLVTIGPRYFDAIGAAIVRGRALNAGDGRSGPATAMINERFAALHFGDGDPIGQRIRFDPEGAWLTVVGVASNVRQRRTESGAFDAVVYLPIASNPVSRINVLAVFRGDPAATTARVREQVRALDPDLPLYNARTVDEDLVRSRWPLRVFGGLFAIVAAVALILAAVGLYAVAAYWTAQRTQEIGVRMALGATATHVRWLVTRGATSQLLAGLLLGSAGTVAIARVLPAMLAGTGGADVVTMAVVTAILLAVGLGAVVIPARRATRLDPIAALRTE
jgi:putative ABC transport system permease protein